MNFKDNMQRDALFRGIPLFGAVMGRNGLLIGVRRISRHTSWD